jgi:hypothetical protein
LPYMMMLLTHESGQLKHIADMMFREKWHP